MKFSTLVQLSLIMFLLFIPGLKTHAQQNADLIMGDRFYDRFEFADALYYYELVFEQMSNDPAITRRIADTYRRMGQLSMSAEWYRKTLEIDLSQPDDMLHYAEALKCLKEYDQAIEWYGRYCAVVPTDRRVKSHLKDPQYFKDLQADSLKYVMKKLDINTEYPAIGVCRFERGQFLISSMRLEIPTAEQKKKWEDELPYLDVYLCDLSEDDDLINPVKLDDNVNCKYHDGPVYYCEKDHTLYITRNNVRNGKPVRDKKGNVNLKIYSSTFSEGLWAPAQELKFNGDSFSNGHPCLSKDGNFMYFVSNRDGGFGGTDIYVSQRVAEGWTEPINLGPNVNTEGDEMFPYISSNGALYFASNGWAGLGGLDIYRSDLAAGKWTEATNLGYPINSNEDDFGILYNNNDDSGFFCSNRDGNGNDDVFFFNTISLMKMILAGVIHSPDPEKTLAGQKLLITSVNTGKVYEASLNEKEEFSFQADPGDLIEVRMASEEFAQDKPIVSYYVPTPLTDPFANIGTHYATPGKLDTRYAGLANDMNKNAAGSKQNTSGNFIPTRADDEEEMAGTNAATSSTSSGDNATVLTETGTGTAVDPKSNASLDTTIPTGENVGATQPVVADNTNSTANTTTSEVYIGGALVPASDSSDSTNDQASGNVAATTANSTTKFNDSPPGSDRMNVETIYNSGTDNSIATNTTSETSSDAHSSTETGIGTVVDPKSTTDDKSADSNNSMVPITGGATLANNVSDNTSSTNNTTTSNTVGNTAENTIDNSNTSNTATAQTNNSETVSPNNTPGTTADSQTTNNVGNTPANNSSTASTSTNANLSDPGNIAGVNSSNISSDPVDQMIAAGISSAQVNSDGTSSATTNTPGNSSATNAVNTTQNNTTVVSADNSIVSPVVKTAVDTPKSVAHGIVLDEVTQAGIPFASVTYTATDGTEHTVMTDSKGKFVITDDVPSKINLRIDKLDYLSCNTQVTLSDSPTKVAPTKVKMNKPFVPTMVRVTGVVNGEKMVPLKGVRVTCTNSDGSKVSVMTDSNGKYSIKTYEQKGAVFTFEKEEYEIDPQKVDIVAVSPAGVLDNSKSANAISKTYDRAIDVAGTVINKETSQPLADVLVTLTNSDGTKTTAITDANGNYSMKSFSQFAALITFEKDGFIIGTKTEDLTVDNVSAIVLDVSLNQNTGETALMNGTVMDPESNQPVANAKVTFKGEDGSVVVSYTDALGRYNMNVNVSMKAKVTVEKDGYEFSSTDVNTNIKSGRSELKLNPTIKKSDSSKQAVASSSAKAKKSDYEHVVDLTALNIDNVLFDYDKAYIREDAKPTLDQIRSLMDQFPDAVLIMSTHSDSRGSTAYNQQLSMSRGMSIKGYLLKQGIPLNRMRIEYFGETRPLNGCIDNVPCNEEEYEVNRRAEFMLVAPVNLPTK